MGKLSFKQFLWLFETQCAHFVFFKPEMKALYSRNCSFKLHETNCLKQISMACASPKSKNLKCYVSSVIKKSARNSKKQY
jgi:hypothetical protein